MADARRGGREEEFFSINPGADLEGWLMDVADHCKHLPLHLHLPIQWLNECLNKVDWKDLSSVAKGSLSSMIPWFAFIR